MFEELERLKQHVVLKRLRVANFSGVIFLCGGQMVDPPARARSARDFFFRIIKEDHPELFNRIFLAETINEWFSDMLREEYSPDLLSFETHLSGLASAICLIVESPGSIAELGSFSVIESIADRLMVAVRRQHNKEGSFISLGPIAYLRRYHKNPERVFVYPWNLEWVEDVKENLPIEDDLREISAAFISDLKQFDSDIRQTVKFDKAVEGHISLLIGDLVDLMTAMKLREIKDILSGFGLEISEKDIKKHLFILEKLGKVKKYEYRSVVYFVSIGENQFLDYNFEGSPNDLIDRNAFKLRLNAQYREHDQSRLLAVRWARGEADGGGE